MNIVTCLYCDPLELIFVFQFQLHGTFDEMLEGESPAPREKERAQTFKRRSNIDLQKCIQFDLLLLVLL